MQLVLLGRLWGFRARQKVPVEFYSQLTGRENKDISNSRSRTLSSARSCAPITGGRDRQRWVILLGGIKGYLERCAEHGLSRSTSAPASSLSSFFMGNCCFSRSEFSTGRTESVLEFRTISE